MFVSGSRFLKTPAADVIYRTISDNMKTINEQKHALQRLQNDAENLRIYNTSPWRSSSRPVTASPLSSLYVFKLHRLTVKQYGLQLMMYRTHSPSQPASSLV